MNIYIIIFFLCALSLKVFVAGDNITTGTSISDASHETLVSPGKMFALGFFTPQRSFGESRYVGIWYYVDPRTVVWVANRDNPLNGSTGVIVIAEDGNLKVLDEKNTSYFSTNLISESSFRRLELLDTGNLVLVDNGSGSRVWQSFDNGTDTFLPGMKMDENVKLTSWKSQHDPASGNFTFQQDTEGQNHYVIYKELTMTYWKSGNVLPAGRTSSFNPSQMFGAAAILLSNFDRQVSMQIGRSKQYQTLDLPHAIDYNYSRLYMSYTGEIQYWNWDMNTGAWTLYWSEPKDDCSTYKACGTFGMCSLLLTLSKSCSCLPGFEAVIPDKWSLGDFSSGCRRTYDHICGNDTFLNPTMMEVGESNLPFFDLESEQCKEKCLKDCQCQAFSYNPGNNISMRTGRPGGKAGCWIWQSELINLRQGYPDSEHAISIRIGISTGLGNYSQRLERSFGKARPFPLNPLVSIVITVLVILVLCGIGYIAYTRMMTKRQERHENYSIETRQFREDNEDIDVPFFEFKSLVAATDDFSDANRLGQGGFGPVYKGELPGGIEIAVKRLSSHSGQGLEEFRNEVVLIAKLQHRNLVRLLGYSMKGDEKMLVYEYMPNKSLDTFIFDRTLCMLLNWTKRLDIILGIARGLLYLHHDSRLRIIHRDLKTSNILLDAEMNPKISDFGLARIVGGNETEASTNRVVGTYGYMSPEYAIEGTFSVKSDVFSFGVVMLEIISGKRNTGFYQSQQSMNRLLGYAWSLWKEEKALELMDEALGESCNQSEFLKCTIVGLLCVQEDPSDRPTMANVVFMLGGDITSLPNPKQPAFGARKRFFSSLSSSSSKPETHTSNEMTNSMVEGR